MNSFVFENNQFIYIESSKKKILLDCNQYLNNKSRVPFHSMGDTLTIPDLILKLLKEYGQQYEGTDKYILGFYYALMDVLIMAEHIKSSSPKKILEIGCEDSILSYHLATMLGKLHPESLLYSISDNIGNESENHWLHYICQIEKLPQLAFAAVAYEDTNLKDDHFDVVVINGNVLIERPKQVIEEAVRVTKPGGKILCFAKEQPLLEAMFQLLLPKVEKYTLDYENCILVAQK